MKNKKRILLVYSGAVFGGIDVLLRNLAPRFYDEYEVVLAYTGHEHISSIIFRNYSNPRIYRLPFKKWNFIFGMIYLAYIIWKEKIDILFTVEIIPSVFSRFVKIFYPKLIHISIFCCNPRAFVIYNGSLVTNLLMFINRKTQKLVDRYSCISPYVCCCLVKEGVALRRIEVIYLGADSSGFQINKSGESAWIVAYVGRHAHEKGTDIFYSIVEAYLEKWKGDRVEFHLFGEGKFSRGKIASLQNKYPNSFIVHGFVEDLSQYHIDCIILPSRDEGFSFVLLEAFFRGIPVIASNQGALPELITDGETGIICNNDDISTYLSAIKKLKENTAFRESVAKNAHQVAEQKFTSQVMQQKYIELIDRLIYCKEGIK